VDWSKVDWKLQNCVIARLTGQWPSSVAWRRRVLGKPQVPHPSVAKWKAVDWSKQNVVIAQELGCSQSGVGMMRKKLGAPAPVTRRMRRSTRTQIDSLKSKVAALRGLSANKAGKVLGFSLHGRAVRESFQRSGGVLAPWPKHPWEKMNFDLPDRDLVKIWKLPRHAASAHRCNKGLSPAKWRFLRAQTVALDRRGRYTGYRNAVKAEKKKAAKFYVGKGLTLSETNQFLGQKWNLDKSIYKAAKEIARGSRKQRWEQMNFDLPSCTLDAIWGLADNKATAYRLRKCLPSPKWHLRELKAFPDSKECQQFQAAVEAEQRKAKQFYQDPPNFTAEDGNRAKWKLVDWKKQNIIIAEEFGFSQSAVCILRKKLGIPPPADAKLRRATTAKLAALKVKLGQMAPMSMRKLAKSLGLSQPWGRIYALLKRSAVVHNRTKHPWARMNFALPSATLGEIWHLPRLLVAEHRSHKNLPGPRWRHMSRKDKRSSQYSQFLAAVRAEKRKAWRHAANRLGH